MLYGETTLGGVDNKGTLFSMNTDGSDGRVLVSFADTPVIGTPAAGLARKRHDPVWHDHARNRGRICRR